MNPYEIGPILRRITKVLPKASDILFSPGFPPKVLSDGQLVGIPIRELQSMMPYQTEMMAMSLMQSKPKAMKQFTETGSADLSITLEKTGRFRINIFRQRGSIAIVMRVIPTLVPSFNDLGLPETLKEIISLKNGIVLITGPTGCGKSSTLAALLSLMSQVYAYHIITIEDPIEFLFPKNKSMIHQRELGGDTNNFSQALRTALRQAPQVIMVGEMRDTESVEIALEAAETGHLILSTLHTIDAAKTIERIIGVFPKDQESFIRTRFSQSFRFIASQRLMPRADKKGRCIAVEILKATERTRSYILKGEKGGSLEEAMEDGQIVGMQTFDGELLKLYKNGVISKEVCLQYATNPNNIALKLGVFGDQPEKENREETNRSIDFDDGTLDQMPIIGLDRSQA